MKKRRDGKGEENSNSTGVIQEYDYHIPVMLEEVCNFLITDPDGIYIDGTLGGGGHTAEILARLSTKGKIIAFDADEQAIEHCSKKFAAELEKSDSRLVLYNDNFIRACSIGELRGKVLGLLLDLGVSSRQLDSGSRGISHRVNSRLTMSFGSRGNTAEDLLDGADEREIEAILKKYGEEPFARVIARRIVQRRRAAPLRSTYDLRSVIEEVVPPHILSKSVARVFQALRIAVNDELGVLEKTLRGIIPVLAPHGRITVISYHSLEDRIVKNVFRELADKNQDTPPELTILTPKPQPPSDAEIHRNPRSRSAKLRVAAKI
jgi:16S rRNA (cytosine1402-N4)-methyltransferase